MTNTELLELQTSAEQSENNNNLSSQNTSSEEIDPRENEPIDKTLLVARKHNDQWFATVGKYKVTENFDTYEELAEIAEKPVKWEQLQYVVGALMDTMRIFNQLNEEENGN